MFSCMTRPATVLRRRAHTIARNFSTVDPIRVLFFGTDEFALTSLKYLQTNRDALNLSEIQVVTTMDRTSERRKVPQVVKEFCTDNDIVVHTAPRRPRGATKSKKIFRPPLEDWDVPKTGFDLGVVISFGLFLPQSLIESFSMGCVNIHPSLLPKYRGPAPLQHTLLNDDKQTGVSIINVHPTKFDCGELVKQTKTAVGPDENFEQLRQRLGLLGSDMLGDVIRDFKKLTPEKQPSAKGVPRAPILPPTFGKVIWGEHTAGDVYNLSRAIGSQQGIYTFFKGARIRLHGVSVAAAHVEGPLEPGRVQIQDRCMFVCCKHGWLEVHTLQMQGKKVVRALDFVNGYLKKLEQSDRRLGEEDGSP